MYVIFPLDQLLDIDSADKNSKQNNSRNSTADTNLRLSTAAPSPPPHPILQNHPNQKSSPNIPEDQSPTESGAVNQGPGHHQLITSPSNQQQDKPPKGNAFSSPSTLVKSSPPSTLPSPPTSQSSHLQQVLSSVPAGGVASLPTPSSTSASSAAAAAVSTTAQGAKGLLQRQPSFQTTTSSSRLTSPQRKNASACASWAGSPPARETPSEITRSASFFLNRDLKVNESALTRATTNLDKSDSFRQQVIKSEKSRTQIRKDSFSQKDTEAAFRLKRTQSKQGRPPAPPEEAARRDARSSSEVDGERSLRRGDTIINGKHTPRQDPYAPSGITFSSSGEQDSEVVGSDGSARSRGSSSSTSKSKGSSNLAGRLTTSPVVPTISPLVQQHSPQISAQPQCPPSPVLYIPPQHSAMSNEPSFKDLSYPGLGETLKSHNSVTFKLIKTAKSPARRLQGGGVDYRKF